MPILNVNHVSKFMERNKNLKHYTILTFQSIKENSLQLWDHLVQVRQPSLMLSVQLIAFQAYCRNQWQ